LFVTWASLSVAVPWVSLLMQSNLYTIPSKRPSNIDIGTKRTKKKSISPYWDSLKSWEWCHTYNPRRLRQEDHELKVNMDDIVRPSLKKTKEKEEKKKDSQRIYSWKRTQNWKKIQTSIRSNVKNSFFMGQMPMLGLTEMLLWFN
jgi:hypothetical protein